MVRRAERLGPAPTQEEREAQLRQTIERIRALTGEQAKQLLEELIARNEVTGIAVHSREFVERLHQ
jgi:hypothetical protein